MTDLMPLFFGSSHLIRQKNKQTKKKFELLMSERLMDDFDHYE